MAVRAEAQAEVRRLRLEFADEIAALPPDKWDLPSWCGGWRIRDVLGHLVHTAEATLPSMFWGIARNGFRPDRAIQRIARAVGDRPVPELVERLRSARARFHVPGMPPEVGIGDLLVHSADALRPAGINPEPGVEIVLPVLDTYMRWGPRVVHAAPHRGVSLAATDAAWRSGEGPEVTGKAIDLLLLVANRPQVIDLLDGPGVAHLRR